jgi:hypothetical protein
MGAVAKAEVADAECAEQRKHENDSADYGQDSFRHFVSPLAD